MIHSPAPIETDHVARHYDTLDPFYRALWGEHVHHGLWETGRETVDEAVRSLVRHVARQAHIGKASRVCDVGCGYGAPAQLLAAEYGASVTGLTLSPLQHERALRLAAADARLTFLLQDWFTVDLPDAAFDAVIAIESTEHMRDKPRFFAEAARVLRPGGRLVVCAWVASESIRPWQRRFLLEPICAEGRLPSLGTAAEYRAWMMDAGLTRASCEDLTPRVRRTWSIVFARMLRTLVRPAMWKLLLDASSADRVFARAVVRILLAYRTGCMRYASFSGRR